MPEPSEFRFQELHGLIASLDQTPYPTGVPPGGDLVCGVDLALVDGDVQLLIHDFEQSGSLQQANMLVASSALAQLQQALESVPEAARSYFETEADIVAKLLSLGEQK